MTRSGESGSIETERSPVKLAALLLEAEALPWGGTMAPLPVQHKHSNAQIGT
jgi:hypothetical protein